VLIRSLPKYSKGDLSDHLSMDEFRCNCDDKKCGYFLYSEELVDAFELLRYDTGLPIRVTSGFRCPEWNKICGGVPNSLHQYGCAIDIMPTLGMSLNQLYKYAINVFDKVIVYQRFLHCSMDLTKER